MRARGERLNQNPTARTQRGSALLMALSLAILLEVVIALVVQEYTSELQANTYSRRSSERAEFASNLASMFVDSNNCLDLVNATLLAAPSTNLVALGTMSPALHALATSTPPKLPILRYRRLQSIGPMATQGTLSLLVDHWVSRGSFAQAQAAAYQSLQPWRLNPSAATLPIPTLASAGTLESRLSPSPNATTLPRAFRSISRSGLFLKELIIFEIDPAAASTPAAPLITWDPTDVPYWRTVPGIDRSFHVWADFGVVTDPAGVQPSSSSILNLAAKGTATTLTSCTTFDNARVASQAPTTTPPPTQCFGGKFLIVTGGTLGCSP